jgi:gliding motility-associated-like protein
LVKNFKYLVLLVLAVFLFEKTLGNHIIGGELIYDKLTGNKYKLTLKIYRNCDPDPNTGQFPPDFDGTGGNAPPCYITVFDAAGNVVTQLDMGAPLVTTVAGNITNTCIAIVHPCVQEGIYTDTVDLPPIVGGYHLVYVRCCRPVNMDNLIQPSNNQGSAYTAFIPGSELVAVNSSPRFNAFPPIDICNKETLIFDHAATDPDGDQLVYSFSIPLLGLDACCAFLGAGSQSSSNNPNCATNTVCPVVPSPPPYPSVNYAGPFNANYPVASNPSLTINSTTGMLTGKPNLQGKFVVNVCVEEYRNNVLLSKHYRDFMFAVKVCTVSVAANVADQTKNCIGQTITFTNQSVNQSQNQNYFWDFGDPNSSGDTSLAHDPSYTYQDTGTYYVTLIVNRGGACTDTLKKAVFVYPPLNINFNKPTRYCVKSNSVNFATAGVFLTNNTFYNWTFPSATPATSTLQSPAGITFTSAGVFSVTLIAKQFACRDTFIDSIRILDRPQAKINNFNTKLCDPGTMAFSNGSISEYGGTYYWQFSDGINSTAYEPTHTFSPAGSYSVLLTMYRGAPCPDTSAVGFTSITVNPLPVPNFTASPTITSIFDPEITVTNGTTGSISSCYYDFGDLNGAYVVSGIHSYVTPGKYTISQTIVNNFGCMASTTQSVEVYPEFRFWAPNAFTPDENNLNELFYPVTVGVHSYKFTIFDTWGHVMFETTEPNKGWDGKIGGKVCAQGVYIWKARFYNDVSEKFETRVGHVTLVKASDEF